MDKEALLKKLNEMLTNAESDYNKPHGTETDYDLAFGRLSALEDVIYLVKKM